VYVALQADKHSPVLMRLICDELNVRLSDVLDFELCLTDAVPAVGVQSCICISVFRYLT